MHRHFATAMTIAQLRRNQQLCMFVVEAIHGFRLLFLLNEFFCGFD
jgi:hypothetical protein